MLRRINRLTKQKDFELAFKKGRSFYDQLLGIKTKKNNGSENRYGIIISTKVSKKAVIRNKIKRQIREIIKNQDKEIKKGLDIIVITFPEVVSAARSEIEKSLVVGFGKLRLYIEQ